MVTVILPPILFHPWERRPGTPLRRGGRAPDSRLCDVPVLSTTAVRERLLVRHGDGFDDLILLDRHDEIPS